MTDVTPSTIPRHASQCAGRVTQINSGTARIRPHACRLTNVPRPQGKSSCLLTNAVKYDGRNRLSQAARVCAGYRFPVRREGYGSSGWIFHRDRSRLARLQQPERVRPGRFDPADGRGVRRRRVRGGCRPAVAVVRRGRDDFGVDAIGAGTLATGSQHRRRARPVLPRHARLVHDFPGDRVLVAAVQLPGGRRRRGGCRRVGQAVLDPHGGGLRGRRLRDIAAHDVGRNRGPVVRAHGGGSGVVDRAGCRGRPA